MILSRRLINIAGTLLAIVMLVAGTALMALPVYFESLDLRGEAAGIAASNQTLVTQIDGLKAQETHMPEIEEDLAGLHRQLPPIPQLDDVSQLAIRAAAASKSVLLSIEYDDPTGFSTRDLETVIEGLPRTATERTPSGSGDPTSGSAAEDGAPADGEDAAGDAAGEATDAGGQPAADTEQLQFGMTINATVPDMAAATRFMDELRTGPRLLQLGTATCATADQGEEDNITLTVTGLVFVRIAA
jgi:hypothetical protein